MANKTYTLTIRWTGEYYEVTIPEIAGTAVGATYQEAIDNGHRAIMAAYRASVTSTKKPGLAKARPHVA